MNTQKKNAGGNARLERKRWRNLSIIFAALIVLSYLVGCGSYLEIDRPAAVNALMTTRKWDSEEVSGFTRAKIVDEGVTGLELWGWGPKQSWRPADTTATSPGEFLEILHLSDAQVRDVAILHRSDYVPNDLIFKSTLRLELIENVDSLLLAAILRGYRNAIESYHPSRRKGVLAVHTGDLLDISLVTEMIDAAAAVNYACNGSEHNSAEKLSPLPLLSVPGNHDGLTFGNIDDRHTKTWELGINRLEFHLASMELLEKVWPDTGMEKNEVLKALLEGKIESIEGAPVFSRRVQERFAGRNHRAGTDILNCSPVALKGKINTDNEEDDALQPGYFSLVRNGFRIIFLDTRANLTHLGSVGPVQQGWLYHELSASLAERQPVLIFAHHPSEDFRRRPEGRALRRIFTSFPHVLGYFYGHKHNFEVANQGSIKDGVWLVQAPSLVDFPMGALVLRVERQTDPQLYRLTVEHVKAKPDRNKDKGLVLDALQDEALVYAWFDDGKKSSLTYGSLSDASAPITRLKKIVWCNPDERPKPHEALGNREWVEAISEERVRVIKEERGAWYDK